MLAFHDKYLTFDRRTDTYRCVNTHYNDWQRLLSCQWNSMVVKFNTFNFLRKEQCRHSKTLWIFLLCSMSCLGGDLTAFQIQGSFSQWGQDSWQLWFEHKALRFVFSNTSSRRKTFRIFYLHSTKVDSMGFVDNRTTLVRLMVWCRLDDNPFPEPSTIQFSDAYMRN